MYFLIEHTNYNKYKTQVMKKSFNCIFKLLSISNFNIAKNIV